MSPEAVVHEPLVLTGRDLAPSSLAAVAEAGRPVGLAPEALNRMAAARAVVEGHLARNEPVYGLTTGLGSRVTHRLPREALAAFSVQTVRGRANAVGPRLPAPVVRAVMLARLNGLLAGGSGAAPEVAEQLALFLNRGLHPAIPSIGSIGAGDLCVLAHLGLALIGDAEAEIEVEGRTLPAPEALAQAGVEALSLGPKDGLAICNASAFTTGQAALALSRTNHLLEILQVSAALSMEGFRANLSPLDPRAAAARPAPGQAWAAEQLMKLLAGGALTQTGAARRLQDPISLRCVAQVHGSLKAALDFALPAVAAELNGTCDNPLVLADDDAIISTGNFHTPALALALETLSQAVAQVASLSVSRTCRLLIERLSGLPANLSVHGPTSSGFAPLLKVAEALLQEIRHKAQPAPADLRWAADGVEDDLTNAPLAARKLAESLDRLVLVAACELIVAAQAAELAKPDALGRGTAAALAVVRKFVPPLDEDRPHGREVERLAQEALDSGRLSGEIRTALGS